MQAELGLNFGIDDAQLRRNVGEQLWIEREYREAAALPPPEAEGELGKTVWIGLRTTQVERQDVEEAGGLVTGYDGTPFGPYRREIICANPLIYDALAENVNRLSKADG